MGGEIVKGIDSPPSEAWLFAQLLLGRPIARMTGGDRDRQPRSDRRTLEWAAQFSTRAAAKLRALEQMEEAERDAWMRASYYYEQYCLRLLEWNEGDHPRHPKGTSAGGEFAPKSGEAAAGKASAPAKSTSSKTSGAAASAPDSSRWYLPASTKGEWAGEKGNSVFRLKTPIEGSGGRLVGEIEFTNGAPILDRFALPGETATIILTGDHKTDIINAEKAWRQLNPGMDLPGNSTFHHDLLHATEETIDVDGQKVKVLVGKMQLVPSSINKAVFHEGTASVAKKYYQGMGIDAKSIAEIARNESSIASQSKVVSRASRKIKPGKIAKGLAPFVGRTVLRTIPIVSSGLAILEFAENAEAHGVGGAIVRATPVLGDLIGAHDLGSELAKEIRDEADAAESAAQISGNEPSRKAWEEADAQTIAAFNELAPQIKVTNAPNSGDGKGLVDPDEITTALFLYRDAMQSANLKRNTGKSKVAFEAEAAQNKEQLRRRLERASQRRGLALKGPLT